MRNKIWSVLLAGALVTGVLSALPANAAPGVPATPEVADSVDDTLAGSLTDQPGALTAITPSAEKSSYSEESDRAELQKKKCKKGQKGKKCKKKKAPEPEACAAFTPGEAGTDKPTVTVTDAATEEAPVTQTVALEASTGDVTDLTGQGLPPPLGASYDYFNIQVDSLNPDAGLYVYLEFPTRRDYDLNLLHPDGSYAARSRGFNPAVETPFSTTGHGGESTDHSEKLVGIRTADCGGWTLEVANWLGEGGDLDVQLWLGEAANDPQPPGEETP